LRRAALLSAFAVVEFLAAPGAWAQAPAGAPPVVVNTQTVGANLNITPKRVTFNPQQRTASVYIFNQGTAPATFDINLIDRAMLPDGQIVALVDANAKPETKALADQVRSAQKLLLVSPRRATLAPGQGQTIRLRVGAMPPDAAGEYRTHLTVTTVPPPNVGVTAEQAANANPNELRFQITSIFGLSIPAIIRVGQNDVRAGIENAHIEYAVISLDGASEPKRTPMITFELVRLGANSLFGNAEIRPVGRPGSEPLGAARGVGVYPEIARRKMSIPLNRAPGPGEKLEVTFTDDDTSPGKPLATATVP